MTTKDEIIVLAADLIKDKGYNAFSFKDIASKIGVKTASIHYYFPTKSDLGLAVIEAQRQELKDLKEKLKNEAPPIQMQGFFGIYTTVWTENNVCLIGSLATDFNTIDPNIQEALKRLAQQVVDWVTEILEEGRKQAVFSFNLPARTKAMMIIGNMLAVVQLARLTKSEDFNLVKKAILTELTHK